MLHGAPTLSAKQPTKTLWAGLGRLKLRRGFLIVSGIRMLVKKLEQPHLLSPSIWLTELLAAAGERLCGALGFQN